MNHLSIASALLALGTCLGTGCGPSSPPDADPPPPEHGVQLESGEYTVPAGQEKYVCFTRTLQPGEDGAAVEYAVTSGASMHHLLVSKTLSPEPDGLRDCPASIPQSWLPLYGGGQGTPGLKLPPGAGAVLAAGDQITVQLHLLNATGAPVTHKTFVDLRYAEDPKAVTPAGIWAIGSMGIAIPPRQKGFEITHECTMRRSLDVFAVLPHMHQHGRQMTIWRGPSKDAAQVLFERKNYSFDEQNIDALATRIEKGEYLRVTCTYDNDSDQTIRYGESSMDEMCYGVFFYTPFTGLDGCIGAPL